MDECDNGTMVSVIMKTIMSMIMERMIGVMIMVTMMSVIMVTLISVMIMVMMMSVIMVR